MLVAAFTRNALYIVLFLAGYLPRKLIDPWLMYGIGTAWQAFSIGSMVLWWVQHGTRSTGDIMSIILSVILCVLFAILIRRKKARQKQQTV
jgi:peptidoglycan/LPS O-acetylase OafA/YrhL